MKRIFLFTCLSLLLVQCSNNKSSTIFVNQEDYVKLGLNASTTNQELDSIASVLMANKNIEIDYSKSKFNADGELVDLNMIIDCNDGYSGKVSANQRNLKSKSWGFIRDYRSEAKMEYKSGVMK